MDGRSADCAADGEGRCGVPALHRSQARPFAWCDSARTARRHRPARGGERRDGGVPAGVHANPDRVHRGDEGRRLSPHTRLDARMDALLLAERPDRPPVGLRLRTGRNLRGEKRPAGTIGRRERHAVRLSHFPPDGRRGARPRGAGAGPSRTARSGRRRLPAPSSPPPSPAHPIFTTSVRIARRTRAGPAGGASAPPRGRCAARPPHAGQHACPSTPQTRTSDTAHRS